MLLFIAFFSGILTVLAPCVLPLLPIILGASAEDGKSKKIPLVIIASLSVSILIFSLLLKASTLLIDVPSSFWKSFSGGLIIMLGIITIFPNLWKSLSTKLGLSSESNALLQKSSEKKGILKYVFMGFALGPVFSSCSPTYTLILAIILPAGFLFGVGALIAYILGLACILFAIALFGQRLIKNLAWASKPNGIFKKILGALFVLVGLAILTGYDKKIEAAVLDAGFLNTTNFEQSLIESFELDQLQPSSQPSPLGEKEQAQDNVALLSSEGEEIQRGGGEKCMKGNCEKQVDGSLDFLNPETLLKKGELSDAGYSAPELVGLQNWINSEGYDSLQELRGKVVMIDFWTLGCINCINTHDETNSLYEQFHDAGLEILGLHAPEFGYEKNIDEVKKAVQKYEILFPVAQDNDFMTWKAYNNRYWPAFYIIDKTGNVRYTHFGEGGYEKKREVIAELLAE